MSTRASVESCLLCYWLYKVCFVKCMLWLVHDEFLYIVNLLTYSMFVVKPQPLDVFVCSMSQNVQILSSLTVFHLLWRMTNVNIIIIGIQVVSYLITSVGHGADSDFLAVSPQVTLVINPVVGCHYFPPGPQLLSQPNRSPTWPVPNYTAWWQRHTGVSSLPKATTQWWTVLNPRPMNC